jgi:hypothetical protein
MAPWDTSKDGLNQLRQAVGVLSDDQFLAALTELELAEVLADQEGVCRLTSFGVEVVHHLLEEKALSPEGGLARLPIPPDELRLRPRNPRGVPWTAGAGFIQDEPTIGSREFAALEKKMDDVLLAPTSVGKWLHNVHAGRRSCRLGSKRLVWTPSGDGSVSFDLYCSRDDPRYTGPH